jgi:hypothetical protein
MTHEELLARIAKLSITPETNVVPSELATALMAVVELHKPATANSFTNNDCICMLPYRKCATIQVIEKELN